MLNQGLRLKLSQKLSPQQIQLMNLIQLSTPDFEQRVKQEIEENVVLEASEENSEEESLDLLEQQELEVDQYLEDDIPVRNTSNYDNALNRYDVPELPVSLHQYLCNQLGSFDLNERDKIIAEFLIGSIDENGYMRFSSEDLIDDLAFKQNIFVTEIEIEKLLRNIIHKMDPSGIGARNLKESILLQLSQMTQTKMVKLAREIISKSFDLFSKKHYTKLIERYHIEKNQLHVVIRLIETLNPKPGSNYIENNKSTEYIIPDFIIQVEEGLPVLELNSKNLPELYISDKYKGIIENYKYSKKSNTEKETFNFVKRKIDSAKWFIDAIQLRYQTLYRAMKSIIEYQKEYFITGNQEFIKPMILKDIAERIGMDVSTVSRIANSKYVSTPYGVKLVKDFFSEGIKTDDGEDISSIKIKSILQQIVNDENKSKPLRDEELVNKLKERDITIARRTVAKYRDMLNIPVARLRKKF